MGKPKQPVDGRIPTKKGEVPTNARARHVADKIYEGVAEGDDVKTEAWLGVYDREITGKDG